MRWRVCLLDNFYVNYLCDWRRRWYEELDLYRASGVVVDGCGYLDCGVSRGIKIFEVRCGS